MRIPSTSSWSATRPERWRSGTASSPPASSSTCAGRQRHGRGPLAQTVASSSRTTGSSSANSSTGSRPRGSDEDRAGGEAYRLSPRAGIEMRIFLWFVLPSSSSSSPPRSPRALVPAADLEILELNVGQPVHVPRPHPPRPGTGRGPPGPEPHRRGRTAAATFTLQGGSVELTGSGLDTGVSIPATPRSCPSASRVRRPSRRRRTTDPGGQDPRLNLDYAARSLDPKEAERILTRPRRALRLAAVDFVRAKAHLAFDDKLRRRLLEPGCRS